MGPLRHCHRKLYSLRMARASLAHARCPPLVGGYRVTNLKVCSSGAEVGDSDFFSFCLLFPCRSLYLPKVPLLPLGVFLSAGVPLGLSPALLAARSLSATSLCQVQCVLRFSLSLLSLPQFPRPLSHPDNRTSERRLFASSASLAFCFLSFP